VDESQLREHDEAGFELKRFVQTLRIRLNGAAVIESKLLTPKIVLTSIVPDAAKASPVSVVELGDRELIVNVAGGRWELSRNIDSVDFFKSVVESAIKGDVRETFGLERVDTRITFSDGTFVTTTTRTLGGIIPTPGWRHWGRKVRYEPYLSDNSLSLE
jgi:hypothetical protein